jgi:hypothetical protein
MKLLKTAKHILAASMFFTSMSSFAKLSIEDLAHLANENSFVKIVKEDNQYKLQINSLTNFDKDGNILRTWDTRLTSYVLSKKINMPIEITLTTKSKVGNSVQYLGFGDDDKITGHFNDVNYKKVQDLFATYHGTSTNVGLAIIGGGYTSVESETGISISEGNGSIFFIGPSGMPVGVNSGFERMKFDMNFKSSLSAVEVDFKLTEVINGKIASEENKEMVMSLEEVYSMPLYENIPTVLHVKLHKPAIKKN